MTDTDNFAALRAQLAAFSPRQKDAFQKQPLVLAYIGDAVFELAVRTHLTSASGAPVHDLHRQAEARVRATAQAQALARIESMLTDVEQDVARRARNTKSAVPRSATVAEYRYSTALEAVLGYLFLAGELDRLTDLLVHIVAEG